MDGGDRKKARRRIHKAVVAVCVCFFFFLVHVCRELAFICGFSLHLPSSPLPPSVHRPPSLPLSVGSLPPANIPSLLEYFPTSLTHSL